MMLYSQCMIVVQGLELPPSVGVIFVNGSSPALPCLEAGIHTGRLLHIPADNKRTEHQESDIIPLDEQPDVIGLTYQFRSYYNVLLAFS